MSRSVCGSGEIPVAVRSLYALGPRTAQRHSLHIGQAAKPACDVLDKSLIVHPSKLTRLVCGKHQVFN
jgi:hypothetical protein